MKTLVGLCNVAFLAFSCLVMLTDGFATEPAYVALSLLLIAVPVLTLAALRAGVGRATRRVAGLANIILIFFIAWAFIDQYPHPSDPGFAPYVLLGVITPLLSAAFLFFGAQRQPAPRAAV